MSSKAKVIPFENDDLKVEELKQVCYDDDDNVRRVHSSNHGKINYENFVKKQQENKSQNMQKKNTLKIEKNKTGGRITYCFISYFECINHLVFRN